jgi:hypothetical protein
MSLDPPLPDNATTALPQDKPYPCDEDGCKASYNTSKELKIHRRIHQSETKFHENGIQSAVISKRYQVSSDQQWLCDKCPNINLSLRSFRRHWDDNHKAAVLAARSKCALLNNTARSY